MKEKNQYNLDEAVKELYKTEPLRQDLASTVANKVFAKQKTASSVLDKILVVTLFFVITASLVYGFSLLGGITLTAVLIFVITIAGFIGLSVKEHLIMLKRINNEGQNARIF